MPADRRSLVPAIFLALLLASCKGSGDGDDAAVARVGADTIRLSAAALKNVHLATARTGDFPERLSLMGRISVTEDRVAVVPARVGGRIDSVSVSTGEQVARGQALAEIFSADYAVAREEYVQALKQPKGEDDDGGGLDLARMTRSKLESLGLTPADVESIARGRGGSQNLVVRSPRDGVLLDKKAVVGNFVNVGDTLFTVGDLSKVWFAGDIYPEDLAKVHKNQEVVIEAADSGPPLLGQVSFISPVVDPTSRTIKIRALMSNPGNRLRADMYVRGSLTLSTRRELLVPKNALLHLRDTLFCFKRTGPGLFTREAVKTGGEQDGLVAVTQGLSEGDEVVDDGALLLDAALESSGSEPSP